MELTGLSFVGGERAAHRGQHFHAVDAVSGKALDPAYYSASMDELNEAVNAAAEAFPIYSKIPAPPRAAFLRDVAAGLEEASAALVLRATAETGLPETRLQGEVMRASQQLQMFAGVLEEGSWVGARIDTALPERKPVARPDLRSMLFPLGPVGVFGASNFPLAFSVVGGDTASALAVGCPVVVKAHPAHPATSEIAANVISTAVLKSGMPPGTFSMLFDAGHAIGEALVTHPGIEAIAFTGSKRGGRALMDLAAKREQPIPCFTEMSSINPVFVLPGALAANAHVHAQGLYRSFTLGAGQFCTKPGIVFVPKSEGAEAFREELRALTQRCPTFTMLTPDIADAYRRGVAAREELGISHTASSSAVLWETDLESLLDHVLLQEELFGPSTVLVWYEARDLMLRAATQLGGHLTATVLGTEKDLAANADLIGLLERKVGRLVFNGFPTGVEVSHAMVHGGPYPATSDSRFTSVGSAALLRFVRPRCYQNFPQAALPEELHDGNPLGILRMVNGTLAR